MLMALYTTIYMYNYKTCFEHISITFFTYNYICQRVTLYILMQKYNIITKNKYVILWNEILYIPYIMKYNTY
jgi:hypothetical protein